MAQYFHHRDNDEEVQENLKVVERIQKDIEELETIK
jgi:hypothetical protein